MRAPCCKSWYDCRQCHNEAQDHELRKEWELVFGCKKCKHVFRKDMRNFDEETDGFCPKCDNQFFIEAKTPQGGFVVQFQGDSNMVRDDREKQRNAVSKQTEEMNRE
jgi:uncharacterized CHY-type Zn-finger protein